MKDIGLQIYTVRDRLQTDAECEKTFATIKQTGYSFVQLAGDKDMISRSANACKKLGINVYGILTDLSFCIGNAQFLFDTAKSLNATDVGISGWIGNMEKLDEFIDGINAFAKKTRASGFTFSYHNHACEFGKTANGETFMDVMIKKFSADVSFMPDTYWLQHGGQDVTAFIEKVGSRIIALHLKDMKVVGNDHTFAEIGVGNLDFNKIISVAKNNGVKTFIVEQDVCDDCIGSIKTSYENLKRMEILL